ncbi:trafficking protein particle complex subunit 13-like [Pocillopora damicornis]|uniref:trafficking protein particle complex subunit 13-like n=1 Tax=Pocillopora damicornis TaxID=46731 RepID=UPI000F55221D|nr:trafficking protein particle complex subunit 13-like [Pocillopora damicornis]
MDTGLREREHLLNLKVMRLTRPSLFTSVPVTNESQDLPGNTLEVAHTADITSVKGLSKFALGELFVLPHTFGNIFLGEVFSSYVSVHNDSNQPVKDIVIKTDLQTSSQRLNLSGTANMPVSKLDPEESFDQVIQHEVKELGTHILVCAVNYATLTGEKMYFRKFFKFQVLKPLDVKTKFYNAMGDEVFLEAQVQNITSSPMVMESVRLEPSAVYTVTDLNSITIDPKRGDGDGEESITESIFGQGSYMNPNDTRQYLYRLAPVANMSKNVKVANVVGKLDIVWRTAFGERGRLQTSQLQRVAPPVLDIKMSVIQIPDAVLVEKRFPVKLSLRNTCERKMDLKLFMTKSKDGGLMWCGTSGKSLGFLLPGNSVELLLNLLPLAAGLQSVGGLQIVDCLSSRTYELDNLSQVFVYSSEVSPFLHQY